MLPIIGHRKMPTQGLSRARSGFTLIEALTATFISMFVFLGAWSIYVMSWTWWHETAPRIDAQRIARTALSDVIDGSMDPTVGTDTIGSSTCERRNGIAWTIYDPAISSSISVNDRIDFGLEPDAGNARAFYLGLDNTIPAPYNRVVYYKDNLNVAHKLNSTLGIRDLRFEKVTDATINKTYIRVTVTAVRDVTAAKITPYHIEVTYSGIIYLRNVS